MELVERYLQAVQDELPRKSAKENIRELRANLTDELEHLAHDKGRELSADEVSAFVQQQDHPKALAHKMAPEYPLVASKHMRLYISVLKKTAIILFVFALFASANQLVKQDSINAFSFLFYTLGSFLDNIGLLLIIVTGTFYVLGRNGYLTRFKPKGWRIDELPQTRSKKIDRSDILSDVTGVVFVLLLCWTSLWMSEAAQRDLILSLAPNMQHWRIIFTLFFGASLLMSFYRLSQKYWNKTSLGVYIIEECLFVALFAYLITQPALLVANENHGSNLTALERITTQALPYLYYGLCGVLGISAIKNTRQWLKM